MGHGQQGLPRRPADGRGADRCPLHRGERADLGASGQEGHRQIDRPRSGLRLRLRARGLLPHGGHRGPPGRHRRLQREAEAALQGAVTAELAALGPAALSRSGRDDNRDLGRRGARVRTAYFFRGRKYVRYDVDPATGAESVNLGVYPRDVSAAWTAMPESFRTGIDAVVSWPDGFVYFFKGSKYVRWDATNDTVDAAIYPRDIREGWRAFPASFAAGIDAAINWGDGRAFFFKGAKYIRYDIGDDTVDPAIYPRDISDGWSDFPAAFAAGVDAAVNWGNGSAYFFKGGQYLNYDIGGDKVRPGYPLPVTEPGKWPALVAAGFAGPYDDVIEWPQADVESATIPANLVPCVKSSLPTVSCGGTFEMKALFVDANPSVPACGEYRQYVRGT